MKTAFIVLFIMGIYGIVLSIRAYYLARKGAYEVLRALDGPFPLRWFNLAVALLVHPVVYHLWYCLSKKMKIPVKDAKIKIPLFWLAYLLLADGLRTGNGLFSFFAAIIYLCLIVAFWFNVHASLGAQKYLVQGIRTS